MSQRIVDLHCNHSMQRSPIYKRIKGKTGKLLMEWKISSMMTMYIRLLFGNHYKLCGKLNVLHVFSLLCLTCLSLCIYSDSGWIVRNAIDESCMVKVRGTCAVRRHRYGNTHIREPAAGDAANVSMCDTPRGGSFSHAPHQAVSRVMILPVPMANIQYLQIVLDHMTSEYSHRLDITLYPMYVCSECSLTRPLCAISHVSITILSIIVIGTSIVSMSYGRVDMIYILLWIFLTMCLICAYIEYRETVHDIRDRSCMVQDHSPGVARHRRHGNTHICETVVSVACVFGGCDAPKGGSFTYTPHLAVENEMIRPVFVATIQYLQILSSHTIADHGFMSNGILHNLYGFTPYVITMLECIYVLMAITMLFIPSLTPNYIWVYILGCLLGDTYMKIRYNVYITRQDDRVKCKYSTVSGPCMMQDLFAHIVSLGHHVCYQTCFGPVHVYYMSRHIDTPMREPSRLGYITIVKCILFRWWCNEAVKQLICAFTIWIPHECKSETSCFFYAMQSEEIFDHHYRSLVCSSMRTGTLSNNDVIELCSVVNPLKVGHVLYNTE